MHVKCILIWLKEFQFGENKLANFGLSFFNLAKILAKESKTLPQALVVFSNSDTDLALISPAKLSEVDEYASLKSVSSWKCIFLRDLNALGQDISTMWEFRTSLFWPEH